MTAKPANNLERFVGDIQNHLDLIDSLTNEEGWNVHKKACYLAVIDSIAGVLYPDYGPRRNKKRFVSTIRDFSGWKHADFFSLPHVAKFIDVDPRPALEALGKHVKSKYSVWCADTSEKYLRLKWIPHPSGGANHELISLDNDLPSSVVAATLDPSKGEFTKGDRNALYALRHVELLYTYRCSVLHTFRLPGVNLRPELDIGPYYDMYFLRDRETGKLSVYFHLVYPVSFFAQLARNILEQARLYLLRNRIDPLALIAGPKFFWFDSLNVNLGR